MTDIVRAIMGFLISLFFVSIIYMMGMSMGSGFIKPIVDDFNTNDTVGIGEEQYEDMSNGIIVWFKRAFWIIFGIIFFFVTFRVLFRRDETVMLLE